MAVHCHNGCEYDHLNEYAARLLRENEQLWQFVNSCTNSIDGVVRDKARRLGKSGLDFRHGTMEGREVRG